MPNDRFPAKLGKRFRNVLVMLGNYRIRHILTQGFRWICPMTCFQRNWQYVFGTFWWCRLSIAWGYGYHFRPLLGQGFRWISHMTGLKSNLFFCDPWPLTSHISVISSRITVGFWISWPTYQELSVDRSHDQVWKMSILVTCDLWPQLSRTWNKSKSAARNLSYTGTGLVNDVGPKSLSTQGPIGILAQLSMGI